MPVEQIALRSLGFVIAQASGNRQRLPTGFSHKRSRDDSTEGPGLLRGCCAASASGASASENLKTFVVVVLSLSVSLF